MKTIFTKLTINFLLIALFAVNLTAQENPKPILIEKFVRPNCEYVLMQMDNFMTQLQNDPSATGYIIVSGKSRAVTFAEREIKNWLRIRNFDQSRIILARGGGDNDQAEIALWIIPPGAETPEVSALPEFPGNPEKLIEPAKPYLFASRHADEIEGCNAEFNLADYAEEIKKSPRRRGNIVIHAASQSDFRETEKELLTELTNNSVPRKKLKTFFVKVKPNQARESVELWLLP